MYVVTVEFDIAPDHLSSFLSLMRENARLSRETEPGCRHFDVAISADAANLVFLYEIYDDRAAFEQHLASGHFRRFDAQTRAMVRSKAIRTWSLSN